MHQAKIMLLVLFTNKSSIKNVCKMTFSMMHIALTYLFRCRKRIFSIFKIQEIWYNPTHVHYLKPTNQCDLMLV